MADPDALVPAADAHAHDLAWLVRLRWVAVAGQLATIGAVSRLPGFRHLPWGPLLSVVAVAAATNAALAAWSRRAESVPEWVLAAVMGLDVGLLTALLWLAGGPYNPFAFLYLIHIALAAVILRPAWTWALVVLSALAYGALFVVHPPMRLGGTDAATHLRLHLEGMWVAFGVAAVLITFFVGRVRRALVDRERALSAIRARSERAERLAALGTLAAGAAHELSTPLATIAVVARELERSLDGSDGAADARLIRQQVDRCRHVLDQMVSDAGEQAGEPFATLAPGAVAERALAASRAAGRGRLEVALAPAVAVPERALVGALRGLVDNAADAAGAGGVVTLRAGAEAGTVYWEVVDDGPGMTEAVRARAGEPFFTTKAPGRGMGLGLFLARNLAERLGGHLDLDSAPGRGTTVRLSLPAPATAPAVDPGAAVAGG